MIQIRDLRFAYGESFQLSLAALDIAAGQKVAIVGRSGCGKTTLLNLLSGVEVPASGEIHVAGSRVDRLSDAARRRFRSENIGFVFQELELVEYLSVRENILLPLVLRSGASARSSDVSDRLKLLLESTGLTARASHYPKQLSQGQRQRAALCRALITRPQLLLADEPTGNLDHQTARDVMTLLMDQVAQSEATLVMVTHDDQLLSRFDRVIELEAPGAFT